MSIQQSERIYLNNLILTYTHAYKRDGIYTYVCLACINFKGRRNIEAKDAAEQNIHIKNLQILLRVVYSVSDF